VPKNAATTQAAAAHNPFSLQRPAGQQVPNFAGNRATNMVVNQMKITAEFKPTTTFVPTQTQATAMNPPAMKV